MESERPLAVVFFRTGTGNEPVREWLRELPKAERKMIGADILTVQYAWPLGKPVSGQFGRRDLGSAIEAGQSDRANVVRDHRRGNRAAARFH